MSFLRDYEIYAKENEASPWFHKWGAFAVLSAVVSRKIWFDQNIFKVYPNLYIILVGEPGDKKTTALNIARSMVRQTKTPIAPPSITKESMTLFMSQDNKESPCNSVVMVDKMPMEISHLSIFASEIVTMLSAGGNPEGMINFLTDIYDQEVFEVMTKNKGNDLIVGPYITIFACMTPEQTGQLLKQTIISGGFSRRSIFVFGRGKGQPVPFPTMTKEQEDAYARCIKHLQLVKKFKGQYSIAPDAKAFFDEWYRRKFNELSKPHSSAMLNWLRTKDVQLLKLAMLIDVAEDMKKVITLDHLHRGLELLDSVDPELNRIFAGAGRNVLAELASKIESRLLNAPNRTLPKKQILAALFSEGDADEITKAIDFLVMTGRVQRLITTTGPTNRKVQVELLKASDQKGST